MKRCEKGEIEQFIIGKNLYYDQTFPPYFFGIVFTLQCQSRKFSWVVYRFF